MNSTNEIRKKIRVRDAWFSPEGLELLYYFEGKERFERLTALQAAELMLQEEIIQDFCNDDNYLEVCWFVDAEYTETGMKAIMKTASWEMFASHNTLCQYEIIALAARIERSRQEDINSVMFDDNRPVSLSGAIS